MHDFLLAFGGAVIGASVGAWLGCYRLRRLEGQVARHHEHIGRD